MHNIPLNKWTLSDTLLGTELHVTSHQIAGIHVQVWRLTQQWSPTSPNTELYVTLHPIEADPLSNKLSYANDYKNRLPCCTMKINIFKSHITEWCDLLVYPSVAVAAVRTFLIFFLNDYNFCLSYNLAKVIIKFIGQFLKGNKIAPKKSKWQILRPCETFKCL